jgi:uncharacterized protein
MSRNDIDIDVARQEIIDNFAHHWELNDKGHRQDHFEEVFQTAKHINEVLELGYPQIDMLFAAYFHDFFAWTRVNHHTLAWDYFRTADHPVILKYYGDLPRRIRDTVADACREHRASFKGEFAHRFAELINSADRGFPGHVQRLLQRTYNHRLTTYPDISPEERMKLCVEHMKEKAGSKGYARYPDLYTRVFGKELKAQMEEIDNL